MDAIRERLQRLEVLVGEPQVEDPVNNLMARLEDLAAGVTVIQNSRNELMGKTAERFKQVLLDMISFSDNLRKSIEMNQEDIALLKKALHGGSLRAEGPSSKFKVPEPEQFRGKRDAKELENFLWDMESYFQAMRVPEAEKVSIKSMYLSGDAKLWWRTRVQDYVNSGRPEDDKGIKKKDKGESLA
ncbi:hypothetical protein CFOL_v3_24889 [Cephalotus follicularis]|uniref:Uncharacterized protein n=1 Tax=Cephalotus follicularis TaxID=3775 RepID=A0A1Q3CME9_CEPFO|nr:hypothetical protein CFOL_v3_24889 [Cephalotus follicularis]